ncbi:phosphotransferase family protein [Rubrivirga sp.]|uniref:phosphotransferase family protein n=1 Tax=Rubrivirga sp. TaxID=1885344 RepID=UPI003B51B85C
MAALDQPADVRVPLDRAALAEWLGDALGLGGDLDVRQFPSGFSNLTYLVTVAGRDLVLRRPPPGADVQGGHDMGREVTLLTALWGHLPVPQPLGFEPTGDVLGAPFFVMERVEGAILRSTTPSADRPDAAAMATVADAFLDTFAALHAVDLAAVGLADFGRPQGYVRRQIDGWTRRYDRARTDDVPAIDRAFAWLDANAPPEGAPALIHNDYKYDNLVLDPADLGTVRAVLDWELATVGDPLMDLGSTLGYWIEADDPPALKALALSPTWWPGNPTRDELVRRYAETTGRDPGDGVAYAVYGLLKLAVIAQQIYARWRSGHATDPRFEGLLHTVRACGDAALRAIDRGRLS